MYKNLREFVSLLEERGELLKIEEFVDPLYEIAEITDRVSKLPNGGAALLFENTGYSFPVITNMMGSRKRIEYAIGVDSLDNISLHFDNLIDEVMKSRVSLIDKLRLLPIVKEASQWFPKHHKGTAPCQEVILSKPDLNRLPILKCWERDGGRFITLPMVHTIDPHSGNRNVGMYRMQLFSGSTVGMHWHRHKTGYRHFSEHRSGRFPVVVTLGGDPVYTYCATAPLPDGIDEYLLAGFLRNRAVEMVDCLTQPIKVPADCDFVIEGYIDPNEDFITEGPFGDHTGFYSMEDLYPLMHISCISHRKDAIYPATLVGVPPQEDKYIAMATEKIFLTPIRYSIAPELSDLFLPEEGVGHNIAILKIKKSYPGQAIKVAHSMWGAGQMAFNKIMIITDEDIDIREWDELYRVINKNYNPRQDSHFSRGPLDMLDHAAPVPGYGGKILIDATIKLPEEGSLPCTKEPDKYAEPIYFTHSEDDLKGKINIILDKSIDISNRYISIWLWGANFDPIKDTKFVDNRLVIDSTTKLNFPKIATSSKETIDAVDKKWDKLGIGEFIKSPSERFL